MKKISIREASRFVESEDGALTVRIIREGLGSTGFYSRELLESSAELFSNTKSFDNHPEWNDPTVRSFNDIVGIVEEAWFSDHEGFGAIYGKFSPREKYRNDILELKEHIGLSIFAMGEAEEDASGAMKILSFAEDDPYRSVDVVIAPGAGGSFVPFMESRRTHEGSGTKEGHMELEDLAAKIDALAEKLVVEQEPADDEVDVEATVAEAVEAFAAAVESVQKADLTDVQRESLIAKAKTGVDISEQVAEQVELRKSILAESAANENSTGNVRTSEQSAPKSRVIKGW